MTPFRASVLLCVGAAVVSCTDPRARPVPPITDVQFAPSFRLTSPGRILGTVYALDDDGLDTLRLTILSADSSFTGDSLFFIPFVTEFNQPLNWLVPSGLAIGSSVRVVARVTDLAGFVSADTVQLVVQDTVSGGF